MFLFSAEKSVIFDTFIIDKVDKTTHNACMSVRNDTINISIKLPLTRDEIVAFDRFLERRGSPVRSWGGSKLFLRRGIHRGGYEGRKCGFALDRAYGIKVYSFCKGSSLSVPQRGRKIVRTTCGSRFRSFAHATRKQDLRFESLGFGAKVFFCIRGTTGTTTGTKRRDV